MPYAKAKAKAEIKVVGAPPPPKPIPWTLIGMIIAGTTMIMTSIR